MNTHFIPGIVSNASIQQSPTFLAPVISFVEDSFSTDWGQRRNVSRIIQGITIIVLPLIWQEAEFRHNASDGEQL